MSLRDNLNWETISGGAGGLLQRVRLSPAEMVFLIAALIYIGFIAFFFLSRVQPLKSELSSLQEKRRELQARKDKYTLDEQKRTEQASNAERIMESLGRFEGFLKPDERGMTQIINEIDSLGKTHKVIVGDASYRVAEADVLLDEAGNPLPESVLKDKKPKIYPALGIDTTVIGDYTNLRRFLTDLERSRQFLIINSVAFQGEADKVRRAAGGAQVTLGSPEAIPVSLKIELDTYFQKPAIR